MPLEANLVDGTVVIKSPILGGNVKPVPWLKNIIATTGKKMTPQVTCIRCYSRLSLEQIFKGLDSAGKKVKCPSCQTLNTAQLTVEHKGRVRKISLANPESTARQLRALKEVRPPARDTAAATDLYIFWTGKNFKF